MRRLIAVCFLLPTVAAAEEIAPEVFEAATGLAQIMVRAEKCGYQVSPEKLQAYFVEKGMDKPEVLAWISTKSAQEAGWADQTTEAECVITRATAQAAGILK